MTFLKVCFITVKWIRPLWPQEANTSLTLAIHRHFLCNTATVTVPTCPQNTSNSGNVLLSTVCPHFEKYSPCHLWGSVRTGMLRAPRLCSDSHRSVLIIICYTRHYLYQQRHLHLACCVSPFLRDTSQTMRCQVIIEKLLGPLTCTNTCRSVSIGASLYQNSRVRALLQSCIWLLESVSACRLEHVLCP